MRRKQVNDKLTNSELKDNLKYNPDTGDFTWVNDRARGIKSGAIAGWNRPLNYKSIRLNGVTYLQHRLAWLYMTGEFPINEIDHINRDGLDNRWSNIRAATSRQNNENRSVNTKFIGVSWDKLNNKWFVYSPKIKGAGCYIGRYKTHLAACYARHAIEA